LISDLPTVINSPPPTEAPSNSTHACEEGKGKDNEEDANEEKTTKSAEFRLDEGSGSTSHVAEEVEEDQFD
jgi:hypothetical protein